MIIGLIQSSARKESEDSMFFSTENLSLLNFLVKSIKSMPEYRGSFKIKHGKSQKKRQRHSIILSELSNFLNILGLKNLHTLPDGLFKNESHKKDYITGFFLACGYMADPEKTYHVEFVCKNNEQVFILDNLLKDFLIKAGHTERSKSIILYLKDSGKIGDLLSIMGANSDRFSFENTLIIKDMRNRVNRLVNCDTANLNKIADVSYRQIKAIRFINDKVGLDSLDNKLKEAAELRLIEPELSLKELGSLMNPPIGKSGINHRMNKLEKIARKLGMKDLDK